MSDDLRDLLHRAADEAVAYRASVLDGPVHATATWPELRAAFGGSLPDTPTAPSGVLDQLIAAAKDGLVATTGPRFFGFVVGGALPAATAADVLTAAWDQNAFNAALAPAAVAAEDAAGTWLKDLLGIPATASVGFVTGAQAANTVGIAAARHHVLAEAGWDVERKGLLGAPAIRVVAGTERHATVDFSLRHLGLGTDVIEPVRTDGNGAMDIEGLKRVLAAGWAGPTIVCLQAGNVNTGAVDNLRAACTLVHEHGGWVHVDGAFGLWATAGTTTRHLTDGVELADSWGCDGHKTLNVPYDSAYAFCSRPDVHAAAMTYSAAYLTGAGAAPAAADLTAESSRRARGFAVWAALRELGRDGVADLVDRCARLARRFADGLTEAGLGVANEVVFNQVLVDLGFGAGPDGDARTDRVIEAIQQDGTCWLGGTTWGGRRLLRISVSNHATTETDVDRSVAAIVRLAKDTA